MYKINILAEKENQVGVQSYGIGLLPVQFPGTKVSFTGLISQVVFSGGLSRPSYPESYA